MNAFILLGLSLLVSQPGPTQDSFEETSVTVPIPAPAAVEAPSLVVVKSKRELQLLSQGEVIRTYRIGLGLDPVNPKVRQGDFATPEGTYYVCTKNPQSRYTLALGLSYPSPIDADRGLAEGMITAEQRARIQAAWESGGTPPWNTRLGGEIMIHGRGAYADWTAGCVALDDADIRELYRVIPVGTTVEIRP